jgi:hypothetical protein
MVANSNIWHIEDIFFQGKHVFDFKIRNKNSEIEFKFGGLEVFHFCEKLGDELISLFNLGLEFVGGLGLYGSIDLF